MSTDTITAVTSTLVRTEGTGLRPLNGQQKAGASDEFRAELATTLQAQEGVQNSPTQGQGLPPGKEDTDPHAVAQAVQEIRSYVQTLQRDLQFEVDLELGRTVISVVDRETKEVIRQIPPEEAVERARRLEREGGSTGTREGLLLKVQA